MPELIKEYIMNKHKLFKNHNSLSTDVTGPPSPIHRPPVSPVRPVHRSPVSPVHRSTVHRSHRSTGPPFTVHRSHRSTGPPFTGLTGRPLTDPPVHRQAGETGERRTSGPVRPVNGGPVDGEPSPLHA